MNLDTLDIEFNRLIVEGGSSIAQPSPGAVWEALIKLAVIPPPVEDPGDDVLCFEGVVGEGTLHVSLFRELTEATGGQRGAVGCDFTVSLAQAERDLEVLVEAGTEPEYLTLAQFIARVESTAAFSLLMASPISNASRWSDVTDG